MRVTEIVEALLFASDAPLAAGDFVRADDRLDEDTVAAAVEALRDEYDRGERAFQIYEIAGGFQLLTRPEYAAVLERFDTVPQPSRLSAPALEVLAIVAYRQPLGRIEIEEIRGVQSSAVLRTLQDRDLIEPVGRAEGLGRPLLYGTTRRFLEHFGFRSLDDLPRPDELPVVLRERPVEAPPPLPAEHGVVEPTAASEAAAAADDDGGAESALAAEAERERESALAAAEDDGEAESALAASAAAAVEGGEREQGASGDLEPEPSASRG